MYTHKGSETPPSENAQKNKENDNKNEVRPAIQKGLDKVNRTDSRSSRVLDSLNSDQNIFVPLLRIDSTQSSLNPGTPDEYPPYIMEASDQFLNPAIYRRYSICNDIKDTFPEFIATKFEDYLDITRDKAVNSITAGENAVYCLVKAFKYLTSGWLGLIIILFVIVTYTAMGAYIFMMLETMDNGISEDRNITTLSEIRKEFVQKIEDIVRKQTNRTIQPDFFNLIQADLAAYEKNYSEHSKQIQNTDDPKIIWSFSNSFIFAGTIISTIGYGHICPKTASGRAVTVVYAIIGIPLFLIALTSFGRFLTRVIQFFWKYIFCYKKASEKVKGVSHIEKYRPSLIEDHLDPISSQVDRNFEAKTEMEANLSQIEVDEEFNLPITVALSILIIYILIGALIAHSLEEWTFIESFYYVFISMLTIGLGDFVLSDSMNMIYSILYIMFGLSLTAMCIDVVQKKLTLMFMKAYVKVMMLVDEMDSNSKLQIPG